MAKEAKYRPYLTLEQLNYIYSLLSNPPQDVTKIDTHIELRQNFKLLQFKANEGLTNPSYMSNPKVDLETSIGITLEEKRKAAYDKYKEADNSAKLADLTDQEIAYAEVYMYENNLMRTDEEAYYEQYGTLIGYQNDENSPTDMHL